MKVEPNVHLAADHGRVPAYDLVLRCKNSAPETDEKDPETEARTEGKLKCGSQLEKPAKRGSPEEEKENNAEVTRLTGEMKLRCRIGDECCPDIVSRSPMRTQECHQYCHKPYEYPQSTSRTFQGVTRVAEADLRGGDSGPASGDVNLGDVSQWLSLCKRDPKFLQQFLLDCKNELSAKEITKLHEYRCGRNECSNLSSRLASPAESPSEQNLTSPESVTYEESSLYALSPNIPSSLNSVNPKPAEEDRGAAGAGCPELGYPGLPYVPPQEHRDSGWSSSSSSSASSNIGTVMLKLAEDPYESTIDLNQFATVCETLEPGQGAAAPERDALREKLDPKAKENAWTRISQVDLDLLGKGDKDGDTQLMILLVSETEKILEYVYVIVERLLKERPEYLSLRNELNQDALYLAAFKLVREPLVAGYIAEALVRGKQDVNLKYDEGNTLLHCLARQGDTHARVLERLVKLRHPDRSPVFDVNKKNNRGFTPLHVACEVHRQDVVHASQTVKVLVENGADGTAKDYKDENTPLHTLINESCDLELLRALLEANGPTTTVVPNRQGNTALHLACGRNTLRLQHHKELVEALLRHGAMIQPKNINGCVPSVLVDSSRKQEIKAILHSHRQKY